jgi:hypothetical protein
VGALTPFSLQAGSQTDAPSKSQTGSPSKQEISPNDPKAAPESGTDDSAKFVPPGTTGTALGPYHHAVTPSDKPIVSNIGHGCLAERLNLYSPDCVVEDVFQKGDGTTGANEVRHCDKARSAFPCWRIVAVPECREMSPQGVGMSVERGGLPVPPNSSVAVSCNASP